MITVNKQVMLGLGKIVFAEVVAIGTQYAVTEHLDNMDDIHDEICGTKTDALKVASNTLAGTAAGWIAGLVTMVIMDAI